MVNWMLCKRAILVTWMAIGVLSPIAIRPAEARTPLKNICRVKGQEENTLRGLGLVVGLSGTGDSGGYLPTMRALARAMELMNLPLGPTGLDGKGGLMELQKTKHAALVWVTATVPAAGARSGDQLDCLVSGVGDAKSLAGGNLVFAALQGPNVHDPRIYALCSGQIELANPRYAMQGNVHNGCRMEQDIFNPFVKDGRITLILEQHHADFEVAFDIADLINTQLAFGGEVEATDDRTPGPSTFKEIARAIDSANIEITIPEQYRAAPVEFVAQVMDLYIFEMQVEARVYANERSGSIVINGDVKIGPVVVTHEGLTVDTEVESPANEFVPVDLDDPESPKLKSLVTALEAMKATPQQIIDIIKGIERNGQLHGRLIVD